MIGPLPDILEVELCRLAVALDRHRIPLIIGGGYGLLLRQRHVAENKAHTVRAVPKARSTEDLDAFLAVEVIREAGNAKAIREALDALGYEVIAGRENYQFARSVDYRGQERSVKIDLLAPAPRTEGQESKLKVKKRRL